MIESKNIRKTYRTGNTDFEVLKGINLSVSDGEFVAITGRSGSGKSTLLYQLGLLDHPTAGEIIIDGVDCSRLSSDERVSFRLRELGYIFQDYALLPDLTALENVALPLLMQGLGNRSYEIASAALERIKLGDRLSNLPSQLSGGEQQRVSIARAIAHKPKILFADEPTANLDSETGEMVVRIFAELNREGQTIIFVTHEPEYAELAHRIVSINDGMIVDERRGKHHQK